MIAQSHNMHAGVVTISVVHSDKTKLIISTRMNCAVSCFPNFSITVHHGPVCKKNSSHSGAMCCGVR